MALKAITFDLWDTVLKDDSDEPKRKAKGLKTKSEERRQVLWEALNEQAPTDKSMVDTEFQTQEKFYRERWLRERVTPNVADRLAVLLGGMDRELPGHVFDQLVSIYEDMEVEIPPDIFAGAADGLDELAGKFPLGVVSDTIYTPGSGMRTILEGYGVRQCFSSFAFSDEIGRAKPNERIFAHVANELDVEFHEMVHIGDRELNDVQGAQALGMKAILFTEHRDESLENGTEADAAAKNYDELLSVINNLAAD